MLTYLQVENLTRTYREKVLFENISFVVNQYQKIALIATNGSGKTTLLNVIASIDSADSGTVKLTKDIVVAYLKQEPVLNSENNIFDEVYSSSNNITKTIANYEKAILSNNKNEIQIASEKMDLHNAWEYENRIKQILDKLKISNLKQNISELSGGQCKRIALAKILITEPEFLILDEPTNHLDMEMIEWLEEFLSKSNLTLLMVTHDRYFLDRVCNEIIELDNGSVFRYNGNYSFFIEKQAERYYNLNKETAQARNLLKKEQEWMRKMPKARTTKAKYRIDSFYELKSKAENKIQNNKIKINIQSSRMGNKIIKLEDICYNWGELKILNGLTYNFNKNEKIGIVGKNGTGKSTFLDIISGDLKPASGRIEIGETIKFGYYKQEGITFNEDTKVIDVVNEIAEVIDMGNGSIVTAAQFLNYFMFPYSMHYNSISRLSGGEKRRLYLVTVLMRNPNFLILDEPTNDLDILTLNVLEDYLTSFKGCVVVVTHDRYFIDKIVDHLFVFEGNGVVKDFPGNYFAYRDYCEQLKQNAAAINKNENTKSEIPKIKNKAKLTFKEKIEIEALEKEIEILENEKKIIELAFSLGNSTNEQLTTDTIRYNEIQKQLEEKSNRWLELSEKT
ncbi:MAG: ABC-F family ATP-binding cassette domain-containing protein [Bacteroidales bacterium]